MTIDFKEYISCLEEDHPHIVVEIVGHFDFPRGERFHFVDPTGNDLAVWYKAPGESAADKV